jgi:hypothetical protein
MELVKPSTVQNLLLKVFITVISEGNAPTILLNGFADLLIIPPV